MKKILIVVVSFFLLVSCKAQITNSKTLLPATGNFNTITHYRDAIGGDSAILLPVVAGDTPTIDMNKYQLGGIEWSSVQFSKSQNALVIWNPVSKAWELLTGDGGGGGITEEVDPLALKLSNNLSDLLSTGTARTNLGATTVGGNIFTITNPSAIGWVRINADNTVTVRNAVQTASDIGAITTESDPLALKTTNNLSDLGSAVSARTNLGATTLGSNLFTLSNVSAIGWIRVNADNTITMRTAGQTASDIGAITSESDASALKIANNLSDLNNAGTARTNLGASTVGGNILTASNPSAIRWIRVNADNTISFRTAAETLSDIGGGAGGTGTVTTLSTGNLSPLFTASVTDPTTTPALSFTSSNTTQYTILGRKASGSGAYSFLTADSSLIPDLHSEGYYNTKYLKNITGFITDGDNTNITGNGTLADPYVINAVDTAGSGGSGSVDFPLTVNSSGTGTASSFNYDGSIARTISYNSIGAVPITRTINGQALSANVTLTSTNIAEGTNLYYTSARFDSDLATVSTTDIAEGTNLYYTAARFNTAFSGKSTTDLTEGTRLYYTTARFNTDLATKTTSNLAEGTNLYYTTSRFNTDFGNSTTTDLTEGTNLYYTTPRFNTDFSARTTTNLAEGTNLYYTLARFNTAFAAKSTSDLAEGSNLYYTNARARGAISLTTTGTSGAASYNSSTGVLNIPNYTTSGGGTTDFPVNFNNAGTGDASGTSFNGSVLKTISYNTIGAVPTTRTVNGLALSGNITLSTTNIGEGTNLYYTNTRARTAITLTTSGTSGAATYNSTTGVLNIPSYATGGGGGGGTTTFPVTFNNSGTGSASGSTFDGSAAITISNNTIGAVPISRTINGQSLAANVTLNTSNIAENTNLYFTNARARTAIGITTIGSAGAATYNSTTGVMNVPNYTPDKAYKTLTYGASIVANWTNGRNFNLTLTGNANISFSGIPDGETIILRVTQDATGGRQLTFPANTYFPLGVNTGLKPNLTSTGGAIDKLSVTYNQLSNQYEVEMAKDYNHL